MRIYPLCINNALRFVSRWSQHEVGKLLLIDSRFKFSYMDSYDIRIASIYGFFGSLECKLFRQKY